MNTKKIKKMIIALVSLIIVIAIGGFSYTYFMTDVFKNEQQLFFKYMGQILEEDRFIESSISQYYEKKQVSPYENTGDIYANIVIPDSYLSELEMEKQIQSANQVKINFEGKTDSANHKKEQNIQLAYSDEVGFPLTYRQVGDLFGLQTKYVSAKFIAFENNNLPELAEKFGMETSEVPNKIQFGKIKNQLTFTKEEKKQIQQRYEKTIKEQLTPDLFTKSGTSQGENYSIMLTGEKIKSLELAMLENFKQDTLLQNKINGLVEENSQKNNTIDATTIEKWITDITKTEPSKENIKITLSQTNKKLMKITVESKSIKLELQKIAENDIVIYTFTIIPYREGNPNGKISLQLTYEGLQQMQQIKENIKVGLQMPIEENEQASYEYQYTNSIKFTDTVSIDSLDSEQAMILNELQETQLQTLMTSIEDRIAKVNQSHMQQLGLEESQNPLLYTMPFSLLVSNSIYNSSNSAISQSEMTELEIAAFNQKFLKYEGQQKGTIIKTLLQQVKVTNELEDRKIEVMGDITIDTESQIDPTSYYRVEINYNNMGYVSKIKITKSE